MRNSYCPQILQEAQTCLFGRDLPWMFFVIWAGKKKKRQGKYEKGYEILNFLCREAQGSVTQFRLAEAGHKKAAWCPHVAIVRDFACKNEGKWLQSGLIPREHELLYCSFLYKETWKVERNKSAKGRRDVVFLQTRGTGMSSLWRPSLLQESLKWLIESGEDQLSLANSYVKEKKKQIACRVNGSSAETVTVGALGSFCRHRCCNLLHYSCSNSSAQTLQWVTPAYLGPYITNAKRQKVLQHCYANTNAQGPNLHSRKWVSTHSRTDWEHLSGITSMVCCNRDELVLCLWWQKTYQQVRQGWKINQGHLYAASANDASWSQAYHYGESLVCV